MECAFSTLRAISSSLCMNIATKFAYRSAPSICALASLLTMRVVPRTSSSKGSVTPGWFRSSGWTESSSSRKGCSRAVADGGLAATAAASGGTGRGDCDGVAPLPEGTWMMPLVFRSAFSDSVRSLAPNSRCLSHACCAWWKYALASSRTHLAQSRRSSAAYMSCRSSSSWP